MFDKYGRGVITWTELSAVMKLLGVRIEFFPYLLN